MDAELPAPDSPLNRFKVPLIIFSGGILLLLIAIRLLTSQSSTKVEFSREDLIATPSAEVLVDVSGAVERPGVYNITSGSRIQDALLAAGGLAAQADRQWVSQSLNLAAKLTDGAKIYIPLQGEERTPTQPVAVLGSINTSNHIININNASEAELDTLPGVGPVTATKIISNRPYQALEELVSKKAVNKSTFEKIKDKISLY